MPRPAPSPEVVARAVEAVASGKSYRDVADDLEAEGKPVSHQTIRRWCAAAGVAGVEPVAGKGARPTAGDPVVGTDSPPSPPPSLAAALEANPPAPPPEDKDTDPDDLEGLLRALLREARQAARANKIAPKVSAQWAGMAVKVANSLAQLEKSKPSDPDVLQFSKSEIVKRLADRAAVVQQMCRGGLRCVDCGRELRIKWSRGEGSGA